MAEDTVTLTIDEVEVTVPKGTTVLQAAESVGIPIPRFCYHPDLAIAGVCRMCLVEVEKMPKLATSCSTVVGDGMVARTSRTSDKVREAVRSVLELHFINHPIDCPICDQAGECKLQEYYWGYGLYPSRFDEQKQVNPKLQDIGPHVVLDADRCILCSRCVRFCREVPKTEELCIVNRGDHAEITLGTGKRLDNAYSANVVDICPVGAHTLKDFRFQCRSWYLTQTPSVCPGCARGCSITVDHNLGQVYRLKPRRNPEVNAAWMCDEGRFLYKQLASEDRLEEPMINGEPASWEEALAEAAKLVTDAGAEAGGLGSPHGTNEENYMLGKLLDAVKSKKLAVGTSWYPEWEGDDILRRSDPTPNRCGARQVLGESTLTDILDDIKTLVVLAHDPFEGAATEVKAKLTKDVDTIVLASVNSATAQDASVLLPIAAFAERQGTYTNFEGHTQIVGAAVPAPGDARSAVEVLAELVVAAGGKKTKNEPTQVFDELVKKVKSFKGLKFANLGDLGGKGGAKK